MKRLLILAMAILLLCGCAESAVGDGGDSGESMPTESVETAEDSADPEPLANSEDADTHYWWEGLSEAPVGKEVTTLADNTADFDYSGYKEIGYDFDEYHLSVMAPESWNAFRFYPSCDCESQPFENGLTGIPIYDGELPVKMRDMAPFADNSYKFANEPMDKSTFFLAFSPWYPAQSLIDTHIDKFDHETYTDKMGRTMQVYFLNGLPKYICYDDYFSLCVWLNLKSEEQIPTVVNMINSVELSLSHEAEFVLYDAKRLGFTVIPPEGFEDWNDLFDDGQNETESFGVGPYWSWREDYKTRPDGKEVTIFADNTFDCDYSGYKKIGYSFGPLYRSVMAPEDWEGFRFYSDYQAIENLLTGTPIYDGEIPVRIDYHDESTFYDAMPMEKSTFFLAESAWVRAQDFIDDGNGLINKFDHETYTDKKGRTMQVYFIDGLPRYACYDDYYGLCIWFNLKSEEQIPIVVNMINSVDVSLSSEAEWALEVAKGFGYTVVPPTD